MPTSAGPQFTQWPLTGTWAELVHSATSGPPSLFPNTVVRGGALTYLIVPILATRGPGHPG